MTKPAIDSRRGMRLALAGLILSLWSCAPKRDLVVRVGEIPSGTANLRVVVWLDRQQSAEVADYALDPTQTPVYYSLGVRLLNHDAGTALVNIAAFDAAGCLLTSKFDDFTNIDLATAGEVAIRLDRLPSQLSTCKKDAPLLIASNSDSDCGTAEHHLTITGWGFHPQAQIKTDGTLRTDAKIVSASRIEIPSNLVAGSGATMVAVEITNPDGAQASGTFTVTAPLFSCQPDTVTYSYPLDKFRYFSGITVADLDNDGWKEIILIGTTEDPAGPGFVSVLANRHDRHFVEGPLKNLSGEVPRSVVTGLYSGAYPRDIVVGDIVYGTNHGRIQLLHPIGNGGSFDVASGCSVHSAGLPWSMAVADLDNDPSGNPDLAVVTNCSENPYLFNCHSGDQLEIYQNVQGTLLLHETCSDASAAYMGVVAGSFLSPAQSQPDLALLYNRQTISTGNPGATLQLHIIKNPLGGMWRTNCMSTTGGVVDLPLPGAATRLIGGDFNKDSYPDLAIAAFPADVNGIASTLSVYLNSATGLTTNSGYNSYSAGQSPIDLALVNYYGADSRDLLVINARGTGFTTTAGVMANDQSKGKFAAPAQIRTTQDPATWVAVGDLDNDGLQDMLLLSSGENSGQRKSSGSLSILFGSR